VTIKEFHETQKQKINSTSGSFLHWDFVVCFFSLLMVELSRFVSHLGLLYSFGTLRFFVREDEKKNNSEVGLFFQVGNQDT